LIYQATSGKNGDTDFDFEIGYVETLAISGLPGVYVNITLRMQGAPTVTEYHEAADDGFGWPYNVDWNYEVPLPSVPSTWPFHAGDPWPIRWCQWYPISECFPVADLTTGGTEMPGAITALFSKTSSQDVTPLGSYVPIVWQTQNWGLSGLWNPGSDPTKIVSPNGINWIRFNLNCLFSDAANQVQLGVHKNGSSTPGAPLIQFSSPGSEIGNLSTGWLPTTATDYWQAIMLSANVRNLLATDSTWLAIEVTS
jgi:hypothetical protein